VVAAGIARQNPPENIRVDRLHEVGIAPRQLGFDVEKDDVGVDVVDRSQSGRSVRYGPDAVTIERQRDPKRLGHVAVVFDHEDASMR
jgi:hypothetical protein